MNRVHYFEEELKLSKLCELQFSSDQISQLILAGLRKDVKNIHIIRGAQKVFAWF